VDALHTFVKHSVWLTSLTTSILALTTHSQLELVDRVQAIDRIIVCEERKSLGTWRSVNGPLI